MSGTGNFDPYYKWLSIPPAEQPPNHYRLLGVAEFEPDSEVIAGAADRQMAHIRAHSTGKYAEISQRILNELAQARLCLLRPESKAAYDKQLSEQENGGPRHRQDKPRAADADETKAAAGAETVSDLDDDLGFADEEEAERRRRLAQQANELTPEDLGLEPIVDPLQSEAASLADTRAAGGWVNPTEEDLGETGHTPQGPTEQESLPLGSLGDGPPGLDLEEEIVDKVKLQASQWVAEKKPLPWLLQDRQLPHVTTSWTVVVVLLCLAVDQLGFALLLGIVGAGIVTLGYIPYSPPRRNEIQRWLEFQGGSVISLCIVLALAVPVTAWIGSYIGLIPEDLLTAGTLNFLASGVMILCLSAVLVLLAKGVEALTRELGFLPGLAVSYYVISLVLTFGGNPLIDAALTVRNALARNMSAGRIADPQPVPADSEEKSKEEEARPPVATDAPGSIPPTPAPPPGTEKQPEATRRPANVWMVHPDRMKPPPAKLRQFRRLELQARAGDILRVRFSDPVDGRAIALVDAPQGRELQFYDLATGGLTRNQSFDRAADLVAVGKDGTYFLLATERGPELHWPGQKKPAYRWEEGDIGLPVRWGALVNRSTIALLDAHHRLVVQKISSGEQVLQRSNVSAAALSAGRRYLVSFETTSEGLRPFGFQAADGEVVGQMQSAGDGKFRPHRAAFRPDGLRLAAVGGGRLVVWNFITGEVLLDRPTAEEPSTLNFVGDHLLALDGRLIDATSGDTRKYFQFALDQHSWRTVPDTLYHVPCVAVAQNNRDRTTLTALDLAGSDDSQSVEEIVFGRKYGTSIAHPLDPDAVESGEFSSAREYVQNVYADLIVRDDRSLVNRMRWFAADERPVVGLRWALGLHHVGKTKENQPQREPKVSTANFLKGYVPNGPEIYEALEKLVEQGRFGIWPQIGPAKLRGVPVFGGRPNDLLVDARRHGIDAMLVVEIEDIFRGGKLADRDLRFEVASVARRLRGGEFAAKAKVSEIQPGSPQAGTIVEQITAVIEKSYALRPISSQTEVPIQQRIEAIRKQQQPDRFNLLPYLLELRYHQLAQPDLGGVQWPRAFDALLGESKGAAFLNAGPKERLQLLRDWLGAGSM